MSRRAAVTLLLCLVMPCAGARAYTLGPATFGSVGGVGAGGAHVLGFTGGQPVTGTRGLAIAPLTQEGAGFWRWAHPLTLATPPPVASLPTSWAVDAAAPNPFQTRTALRFAIPGSAGDVPVQLRVFDLSGRLVRYVDAGLRGPGIHTLTWDGRDGAGHALGAGTYFARLTVGSFAATRRLVHVP